jgi:tetratricopeptide (TPR) repeat protein
MAKDQNGSGWIRAIAAVVGAVASTSTLSITAPQFFLGMAALSVEAHSTIPNILAQKEGAAADFAQGVAFGQKRDWRNAEISFRKAIALDPNYADAYDNLGVTLGKQGKPVEAIAAYQKARDLYRSQGKTQDVDRTTQALKQLGIR